MTDDYGIGTLTGAAIGLAGASMVIRATEGLIPRRRMLRRRRRRRSIL